MPLDDAAVSKLAEKYWSAWEEKIREREDVAMGALRNLMLDIAKADSKQALSPRQLEIVKLYAMGFSSPAIAKMLHIAMQTVRSHTRIVRTKLGVRSMTQAVAVAHRMGLLD